MSNRKIYINKAILIVLGLVALNSPGLRARTVEHPSLVEIESTVRIYDPVRPWSLSRTEQRSRLGVYISEDMILVGDVDNDRESSFLIKERRVKGTYLPQLVFFDSELRIAMVRMIRQSGPDETITPVAMTEATELPSPGEKLIVSALNESGSFHEIPVFYDGMGESYTEGNGLGIPVMLFNSAGKGVERGDPLFLKGRLIGFISDYDPESQRGKAYPAAFFLNVISQAKLRPGEQLLDGSVGTVVMDPGFRFVEVTPEILRNHLGIPEKRSGVMIHTIFRTGGSHDVLKNGDVILGVDGEQILPGGLLNDSVYGKIPLMAALRVKGGVTRGYNSTIDLEVFSGGKLENKRISMKAFQPVEYRIPRGGIVPDYAVLQGGIFLELSQSYLDAIGERNSRFEYLVKEKMYRENTPPERYVILDSVLPLSDSKGYRELKRMLVLSVNGIAIRNLSHLVSEVERLKTGTEPITMRLEGNREFIIDPQALKVGESEMVKRYGITPRLRLGKNN